ncbi:hypothetical protein ACFVX6_10740 [Streptomyces sp. NPDC058289]|uniref:hypothetical protein n=1 Tax=Streptomyces sp. NPDC058289 TaxID=3346425 RepID=UPI0036E74A73
MLKWTLRTVAVLAIAAALAGPVAVPAPAAPPEAAVAASAVVVTAAADPGHGPSGSVLASAVEEKTEAGHLVA